LGKLLDKDGDGRVSKEEAGSEYGALHAALDGDGDGFVTCEEARRMVRQRKESGAGGAAP
jgi:Ca2+-binding EF-hand superfamily protein